MVQKLIKGVENPANPDRCAFPEESPGVDGDGEVEVQGGLAGADLVPIAVFDLDEGDALSVKAVLFCAGEEIRFGGFELTDSLLDSTYRIVQNKTLLCYFLDDDCTGSFLFFGTQTAPKPVRSLFVFRARTVLVQSLP